MKASKVKKRAINCPSCGAPVTMEICPYCGVITGLDSAEAEMEYPVLECKEVVPERSDTFFSLLISFIFIVLGIGLLILFLAIWKVGLFGVVFSLPFLIPGICSTAEPLRKIFIYLRVKAFGKKTQATVYGYLDDENVLINDRPAKVVKLLISTDDGPRFIMYQLRNTLKPYGIGDNIDLLAYKSEYTICNSHGDVW